MAIDTEQIALNAATPTPLLVQGSGAGQFQNITGNATDALPVVIKNLDAAIVIYIGGSDVSTTNGYPLAAGASFAGGSIAMQLLGQAEIPYAIATSGTPNVAVLVGRQ